ncbi:MAG: tetratricopeptide repeat protein [Thiotrichales bacterium]|nr:tetratricopeptide repeat protein [Thiotrichales bacterium]
MSVLLEALKKAAEQKKKSNQVTEDVSSELNKPSPESVLVLKPIENQTFKLSADGFEESKTFSKEDEIDNEEPLKQKQATISLSEDYLQLHAKKTLSIDDLELHDDPSNSKKDSDQENEIVEPIILSNEPAVIKDSDLVSSGHNLENHISDAENVPQKNDVEDSYDWSLEQLPGYDTNAQNQLPEKDFAEEPGVPNPILSTNKRFRKKFRLSSLRQFIFGRSSNVAIFALFSILVLSIVGFFSIYYFQQQEIELDQSMRKYQLVRTALPAELLVKNDQANESSNEGKEAESKESLTSSVLPVAEQSYSLLQKTNTALDKPVSQQIAESEKLSKDQILEVLAPVTKSVVKDAAKVTTPKTTLPQENRQFVITQTNQESDIQKAYTALYAGDLTAANQSFKSVLSNEPDNISALSGFAATQAQLGNEPEAIKYYQKVLSLDANNLHAFEAMISIIGDSLNGNEWKDEIKRVLKIHSDSAVLNYALGNFYAKESDWKAAQIYYFDAYALDNQNADYLVNLAVSLDHLGQYGLAEKYYTLALVNASSQSLNFDDLPIKQRLVVLRQYIGANGQ